jgi:membrane-bound lytic murein transglycosylase D
VSRLIEFFAVSWQPKLKRVITLSEEFFPIYEEILDKHDLPLEFKYLSVIESALQPDATSRAGAAGPWQFMPYTGKLYQLEINSFMDERRHIEKSTEAACKYFSQMYSLYGDWLLVMASYNCGPGNVNKAIRRSGGKKDFWSIYAYLPKETRTYVPSFMAMAYLMNYYQDYGISPAPPVMRLNNLCELSCTADEKLEAVCKILEIEEEDLFGYNPHLKTNRIPAGTEAYDISLPIDLALCYVEKREEIKALSAEIEAQIQEEIYVVKRGESLPVIARKYDCSVSELRSWNGLKSHIIHPGQKLKIYL